MLTRKKVRKFLNQVKNFKFLADREIESESGVSSVRLGKISLYLTSLAEQLEDIETIIYRREEEAKNSRGGKVK